MITKKYMKIIYNLWKTDVKIIPLHCFDMLKITANIKKTYKLERDHPKNMSAVGIWNANMSRNM